MSPAAIALAILQYGPGFIPVIQKLVAWIEGGKKEVTSADLAELAAMGAVTSDQIYADAGVTPPPHAPAATPV